MMNDESQQEAELVARTALIYGPTAELVRVRDLRSGMEIVLGRIGGVMGNPGLRTTEVVSCDPIHGGCFYVVAANGQEKKAQGSELTLVATGGRKKAE